MWIWYSDVLCNDFARGGLSVLIEVSIAIPTYNAEHIVGECLSSLTSQTFPAERMEIVVCDNGSTDETLRLIAAMFPAVKVVTTDQRGSGYARNAAIQASSGRYICSIDADCTAEPQWVAEMVKTFESLADDVVCLGGQILPYRQRTLVEHYEPAWIKQENLRNQRGSLVYAETPNAAFRRVVFDQVGYFDGTQGMDDTDLGIRIISAGFKIQYTPSAVVYHRNPATLRQLYHHRRKYGIFMTRLVRKHPDLFGDHSSDVVRRRLMLETARRVAGDLAFKLPRAFVFGSKGKGTRLWPLLDAVVAVGNWVGAQQELKEVA